ncbi:MAG TPA: hypothetical protein VJL89_04405, partial [Thermodesulfovibrionia bacterium]|nr:hypothetical protein [Thermodesulfovibrionia bacterium]
LSDINIILTCVELPKGPFSFLCFFCSKSFIFKDNPVSTQTVIIRFYLYPRLNAELPDLIGLMLICGNMEQSYPINPINPNSDKKSRRFYII